VDGRRQFRAGRFPVFLHSHRRLEIPWADDALPEKLMLRLANFTVEERRKGTT